MSPPPSSPASRLIDVGSSPAISPSIPRACNFRGQPATAESSMGALPPSDELDALDELSLLARLNQKRQEIETEIEAFKAAKEEEYRELERRLREEQKLQFKKKRKRENGEANSSSKGENITDATHVSAGATSSDSGVGCTGKDHGAGTINYGAQIPLDLGGSTLNDTLKSELLDHRKQIGFNGSSVSRTTTSPPFEKELQAAGLFTPRYLPLLDNNYFRQTSPPISPVLQDPSTSPQTQTSPQQVMPQLASIPSSSSRAGDTSPAYPLASSLKSSSGSSTGTLSKSGTMKQKSPKRVTFQFEDENSVPSRSSPPPTKVHWTLEDDGFVEYEGEAEEIDEDEFDEGGKVEQVEHVTAEGLEAVGRRFPGDFLVIPAPIGRDTGNGNPDVIQDRDAFGGLGISGVPEELPVNGMNGAKAGSDSEDEVNRYGDDDDEEALFDLDETIPEVLDNSPPQRDYSALTDSPQMQTNARLTASSFPMLPSFTPIPTSASESVLTFEKSLGPRPGLPRIRRGSLSSSLSPISNQNQFTHQEPIASSLPNFGWKGIDPPKSGFVPTPGGRFRRRSIIKYDLPEDNAASLKGKGKGKGKETERAISEASDEEGDENDTLLLSRSPNATSFPMSISHLSPAAFTAVSSATRSPKPPAQLVVNNDILNQVSISARPSPRPRSPPLLPERTAMPKIDSADILASMPTPYTADNALPEKNDSVSSYRRSSPFPSAYDRTPYRTAYAAEVAAAAALDDEADYGGMMESVVGGVDGRTGLDPDISSSYMASSLGPGVGGRMRSGSIVGGGGLEAVDPGRMSLGMRMAWESGMKDEGRR